MTLQALQEGMIIVVLPISYRSRPANSHSKLNAFRDGYRIMMTAAMLLRDHNPLRVFGLIALISLTGGFVILPFLVDQWGSGGVSNVLLLAGAALLILLGVFSFGMGLLLNAINTRFMQLKQIMQRNKKI